MLPETPPSQAPVVQKKPTDLTPGPQGGPQPYAPMAVPPVVPSNPVGIAPIAVPNNGTETTELTKNVTPALPPVPINVPPVHAPATTSNGTVALTPTDPNNPLTGQTISVAPTVDRFKIAQDQYDAAVKASDPAYHANLRDASRHAFGAGRGVSGQLRTSLGDEAARHQSALEGQRSGFLSDALKGTIGDAYNDVGIAQQQQGFQKGQQDTAFGQDYATKQLQESLTSGAFGRALQQLQAGNANDPSQIALVLSQIFGSQATGAGNAASGLFGQRGQNSGGNSQIPAWLQAILNGTQATTTDTNTTNNTSP